MTDDTSPRKPLWLCKDRLTDPDQADLLLAGIPLALVFGLGLGIVSTLAIAVAVGVGSILASGAIGYVLILDPPRQES